MRRISQKVVMIPVPELPRWQQYLLLAGSLLAVITCVCLRLSHHTQGISLLPMVLPFLLWWPRPTPPDELLTWWLAVMCVFILVLGLLITALPHIVSFLSTIGG
ncbi:hypothetical protein [Hymenobacter sp.]|jgi:hypothetical protein|uniref:hypothetical protein n=1 Tax=Hymenobacter sp. TaxID=1898978 RepID=UPI002EDAEF05